MADNHGKAAHSADPSAGHPAMDYTEHEKTYNLFIALTKWGLIFNIAILALMAIFLL